MSVKFNPFTGQFDFAGSGDTLGADYPLEYNSTTQIMSAVGSRIKRAITSVVTVESGYTQLFRSPLIGTGGGIVIEADAEAYIL